MIFEVHIMWLFVVSINNEGLQVVA